MVLDSTSTSMVLGFGGSGDSEGGPGVVIRSTEPHQGSTSLGSTTEGAEVQTTGLSLTGHQELAPVASGTMTGPSDELDLPHFFSDSDSNEATVESFTTVSLPISLVYKHNYLDVYRFANNKMRSSLLA